MNAARLPISMRFSHTLRKTIPRRPRVLLLALKKLRFPVGNYLIVYEVGQDEVIIHYVRHGARRRPWEKE